MNEIKIANPDHPIQEALRRRWSPHAFADRPVAAADLAALFEAARWAPSSRNEQPWHYLVARREDGDEHARLLGCLIEANQAWARTAPVLAVAVVQRRFRRNDRPNEVALHDLGLASASLTFEATARGLFVHQMAGIVPERVRELYGVPDGFDPVTALAVGYLGDPATLDARLAERERTPRSRRPLREWVYGGAWGRTAGFVPGGGG